jgi:hypothetical protein
MAIDQPVTEADFTSDRARFLHSFQKFALYTTVAVVVIVALLGIFLG